MGKKFDWSGLTKEIEKTNSNKEGGSSYKKVDDRIFYPKKEWLKDKKKVQVQIRLLPNKEAEKMPYVEVWSTFFKNEKNGKYYVENSRFSPSAKDFMPEQNKDPMSEYRKEMWNKGEEDYCRKELKTQKSFYCNALIIKCPIDPELEGQVKIFKYTTTIQRLIESQIHPEQDEDAIEKVKPCIVFDPEEGADLLLQYEKQPTKNYNTVENSKFLSPSPLEGYTIEDLEEQLHDVTEFSSPDKFKSYDALKARLDFVLDRKKVTDLSEDEEEQKIEAKKKEIKKRQEEDDKSLEDELEGLDLDNI